MKEKARDIHVCLHLEKLADAQRKGTITEQQADEEAERIGMHGISHPNGAVLLVCNRCYAKGRNDVLRLKWVIDLQDFKSEKKGGK